MKKVLVCGFCTEDIINNKSYFGGAAGGIALNLASLKVKVGMLSVLGEDDFSKKYKEEFLKLGVDINLINYKTGRLPLLKLISARNSEKSRLFNDFGTKEILNNLIPNKKSINRFDVLHVVNTPNKLCDYLSINFEGIISYCPGSLLLRDHSSLSDSLAKASSFIFCNREETEILDKRLDFDSLFNKKLQLLLITNGERGVTAIYKNKTVNYEAIQVDKVADTTGGGDAFALGFIKKIMDGKSFDEGIKYGIKLASIAVQSLGVAEADLSRGN